MTDTIIGTVEEMNGDAEITAMSLIQSQLAGLPHTTSSRILRYATERINSDEEERQRAARRAATLAGASSDSFLAKTPGVSFTLGYDAASGRY